MSFEYKLALEASAGSGKTFALSVRYIALLLQNANPKEIVALTFTKKAANEMKLRVFETLENLSDKESELENLSSLLNLSKESILKKADEIFPQFLASNINIETIDSFVAKILKKFSLHLGIMPDFMTHNSTHSKRLRDTFLKEVQLTSFYDSLVKFGANEKRKLSDLFLFFEILYDKSSQLVNFEINRTTYPSDKDVMLKVNLIREYVEKKGGSKTAINAFSANDVVTFQAKSFLERDSLDYRTFAKIYTEELDEMYNELKKSLKEYNLLKEKYLLGELFSMYRMYENSRLKIAKDFGELTFSDISNFVYKLMHGTIDSEFLYFRLDASIKHFLIDEFQDTNYVQFEIFSPLIEEIVSGFGTKGMGSFFYVGDTKQSIYRFRGGSKELFSEAASRFDVSVDALDTNYRSYLKVVEFINNVFVKIYDNYIPQKVNAKDKIGFVKVENCDDAINGVIEGVKIYLDNGVNESEISILCWTNSDISTIEAALRANFPSLHVVTESSMLLVNASDVSAVLEYLKYVYFKQELFIKNAQVLSGKTWDENLIPLPIDFSKPLGEIIVLIIKHLSLDGTSSDLIRLMEVADEYKDIEDFLFELNRINENASSKSVQGVRVLTVHKSKGLEFDHVVVADRLKGENNRSDTLLFEYDGATLKNIHYRMKNREFFDESYAYAKEKEKFLKKDDVNNALYVAFTRAKKSLVIYQKEKASIFENLYLTKLEMGKIEKSEDNYEEYENFDKLEELSYFGVQKVYKNEKVEDEYLPEAIYFGLALHYCLEMMPSFDEIGLEDGFTALKNRYGSILDTKDLEDIKTRIKMLIKDVRFSTFVKNAKIKKEQPLMFNGEKKQIDLLLEHNDKMIIIDYKTSLHVKDEHIKQVKFYKRAMSKISQKQIESYLIYLKNDVIEIKNL